jgi:hypothetical protein
MRLEYVVRAVGDGWRVTRGHTSPLSYASLERALGAAENFARMAVERGDSAVVRIMAGEALEETRTFSARRHWIDG